MEEKKHHLLIEINEDLRTDSIVLVATIKFYERMLQSHDSLLSDRKRTFHEDSLSEYLDHVVSYFPFQETATTYHKILNNQEFSFDTEDSLIGHYMRLHNLTYSILHEWLLVDKDFVLNQAIPYMDAHAPFVYPTPPFKSFHGSAFYKLRKEDAFMNMIKSGRLYKIAMLKSTKSVFGYVQYIKAMVTHRIQETKPKE